MYLQFGFPLVESPKMSVASQSSAVTSPGRKHNRGEAAVERDSSVSRGGEDISLSQVLQKHTTTRTCRLEPSHSSGGPLAGEAPNVSRASWKIYLWVLSRGLSYGEGKVMKLNEACGL